MKQFVRSDAVQGALAGLFTGYLRLVYATSRWTREGQEKAQAVWDAGGPAILCLWHQGIPISRPTWDLTKGAQPLRILISRSSDGEFITRTMANLGLGAIRGSRKKTESGKDKGGSAALRESLRWLKGDTAVAITPDGPHGPARIMGEGAPMMAAMAGAKVLLVGLAWRSCLRAPSWDRTILPLPFGRGAMVWDGPFHVERTDDPAQLAKAWTERLNALNDRAEALLK